jgi:hypothetical protein
MKPQAAYVRSTYDAIYAAHEPENAWDQHTSKEIRRVLSELDETLNTPATLNVGSGGLKYGFQRPIEIDIVLSALSQANLAIVGDAHSLPVLEGAVEAIICVGGVINYLSLPEAISEMSRVLRYPGLLVLEYERVKTLQFIGTRTFRKNISPEPTTYRGGAHRLWRYSDDYVLGVLHSHDFEIVNVIAFHILSPLFLRFNAPSILINIAARLDAVLRSVWGLRTLAGNHLVVAKRVAKL